MVSFEDGKFILRRRDERRQRTNARASKLRLRLAIASSFAAWYLFSHGLGEGSPGWLREDPDASILRAAARDANVRPATSKLSPLGGYIARRGVGGGGAANTTLVVTQASGSRDAEQSADFNATGPVETAETPSPSLEPNPLAGTGEFQNSRERTLVKARGSPARDVALDPDLDREENRRRTGKNTSAAPFSSSCGNKTIKWTVMCWLVGVTLIKLLL